MERDALSAVPDAGTLYRLDSGLEIVRRRKHEPIELARLSREALSRYTDKRHGSKFLQDWTLEQYVDWLVRQVDDLGWQWQPGERQTHDVIFDEPVGVVEGRMVRTVHLVSDGRCVHAYLA